MQDVVPGAEERTPFHMVGGAEEDSLGVVLHRAWCMCAVNTPINRSITKSISLEEIPLLRKMCVRMGGALNIIGGLQHRSFSAYMMQPLTYRQVKDIIRHHQQVYDGRQISGEIVEIFSDVYGRGEGCTILDKMRRLSTGFLDLLPDMITEKDPRAEAVEELLAQVFPHISAEASDVIDVPGLDNLRVSPEDLEAVAPAMPADQQEADKGTDQTAVNLVSETGQDAQLVAFLQSPLQTSNKPCTSEQAEAIAALLAKKPYESWTKDDWADLPDLDIRSSARIQRILHKFYGGDR